MRRNRRIRPHAQTAGDWYERNAHRYRALEPGLPGEIEHYVRLARDATSPVLELCCGDGRVAGAIARAGVVVVGLDRSPAMIAAARQRGIDAVGASFVEADARTFDLETRFGMVCIPYRSFGHMLTRSDQRALLARSFVHLRPGGLLALNIANPVPLARALGCAPGAWPQLYGSPHAGLTIRHVFPEEMGALLTASGLVDATLHGGFADEPFDGDSPEQVWTARRPAGSAHL